MSLTVETKTIGEHTYEVTQLGALVGRKVLFRLGKLLGPLMAGGDNPAAVAGATASLQDADFDWLCDVFAGSTKLIQQSTNGPIKIALGGVFDSHFAGRYDAMIQWLGTCVQVNFASFLAGLGSENPLNSLKMPNA